jgi:long-chain acyl-CoA synthetase
VLQYTGGTTGEPKGAMLTHANFCAVLNIFNYWDHNNVSQGMEKALAVLPLFHIFGLTFIMLLAVANREQVVLHIKFDPDRVLADISRKKIPRYASGIPIIATSATPKNVRLEGPPMLLLAFSNSLSSPADLGNRFRPFLRSAAPFHRFPNRLLPRSCAGPVIQRCPAEQACPTPEAYKMLYYRADQKGGGKMCKRGPLGAAGGHVHTLAGLANEGAQPVSAFAHRQGSRRWSFRQAP